MKAYLINLKRDEVRLAAQREQFARCGLNFERVEARTEGRLDRFRWWCAVLRAPVQGELGCAASHLECYRRLIAGGDGCAAIFEDDVKLGAGIRSALAVAEAKCREDARAVVMMSDHRKKREGELGEGAEIRTEKTDWEECSEGYVIGREAARRLLEKETKTRVPIDYWAYFARKGWIRLYRTVPAVCAQDRVAFGSNLGERYVVAGKSWRERTWWRLRRLIGSVIDRLLG